MLFKAIGHTQLAGREITLPLPDTCPRCSRSISLDQDQAWPYATHSPDYEIATVFLCPSHKCLKPFIAVYRHSSGGEYDLQRLEPRTRRRWVRQEAIQAISPDFYNIYDDALAAEDAELTHAAGPTYRKALEFLVKDYAMQDPKAQYAAAKEANDADALRKAHAGMEHIMASQLSTVIREKIDDLRIKDTAERAAWLGNDETHYLRKWEEHDLQDLKDLISLVRNFIDSHEKYKTMLQRMPKGKGT